MSSYTVILVTLLLVGVALAGPAANRLGDDEHNYVNCPSSAKRQVNLLSKTVIENGFPFTVKTRYVNYPQHGTGDNIITCIRITDLVQDGNGGYPDVSDGGVDFDYASIIMKSQRGYGFKFSIDIFGVPKPTG